MDDLLAARGLMGISLAFHIIYATLGLGLPLLLMIAEWRSYRTGDDLYSRIARAWIRPAGVIFAVGAVSGTILSFELGFLWPRFMAASGPLIGFAFWMEGFAFFTEAIFLALYMFGGKRLSPKVRFLCTIPLTVAAAFSAAFVISANSWMQTPSGFTLVDGRMTDLDPVGAFLNPAWAHQAVHGTLAAYAATGFALAGIYAAGILAGYRSRFNNAALRLSLAIGSVCLPLMLVTGDWAADFVADNEKPKFAAMEALFDTTAGAPLILGGWPDPATGTVRFGIEIPKGLSLLTHGKADAVVEGLHAFPPDAVPDPRLVHPFFDLMVLSFFVMLAPAIRYWWVSWRSKAYPLDGWLLKALVVAAPFGFIALESGWMVTEFGRQPWIIQGVMTTARGVTPNGGIGAVFALFLAVYICLTAGILRLLVSPVDKGNDPGMEAQHARY